MGFKSPLDSKKARRTMNVRADSTFSTKRYPTSKLTAHRSVLQWVKDDQHPSLQ